MVPLGEMGPDLEEGLLGVDCTASEVFPGHPGRGWVWGGGAPESPRGPRCCPGASRGVNGNQRWGGWDLNGFESLPGFS